MLFQIGCPLAISLLPFTRKTKSYGGASKLGKAYGLALASEDVANIGKSQGPNNLDKAIETRDGLMDIRLPLKTEAR